MFRTNSNHIQQDIFGYDLTQMNKVYARIKETAGYLLNGLQPPSKPHVGLQ
jgi:hypothetical protein